MSETILTDAGFARRVAAELDAHGYPNHHMLMVEARRRAELRDPTQDERVRALVEAAKAVDRYCHWFQEGDELRAALRALEQG